MNQSDIDKALEGHENAAAIHEVLALPTEPEHHNDRHNGYIVGTGELLEISEGREGDPLHTTHTLAHWQGPWDPEAFKRHQIRQLEKRAREGLGFLEKPHRKGRYKSLRPSTRAKVKEAYNEQVEKEHEGQDY